eukprot:TRINITY_DN5430_c0_g1_i1.p1 TRINITY_DN5430_c0_g1~~TRINITY_DN5430_c0_g1_i1.p1  ORF type:complete len:165 (+),score=22.98 TRINITY_DN5430_c0_g1_i1:64-558(+)
MDLVLPDAIPVLEAPILEGVPRVSGDGISQRRKEKAVKYFVRNKVAVFIDTLLGALYAERPSDPIAWLMEMLVKKKAYAPDEWSNDTSYSPERARETQHRLAQENDAIRHYATMWKIPFLMDELLCDMLLQEPEEPEAFTLSWLRWNHASFISRHFEGGKLPGK